MNVSGAVHVLGGATGLARPDSTSISPRRGVSRGDRRSVRAVVIKEAARNAANKHIEHTRTPDFEIAYAIGLGTIIAAGILSLSGTAVAEIGSSAVIAVVVATLVAALTAASYSEFASIYSENGGGYLFSSRTFEHDTPVSTVGAMLFRGYTGTTVVHLATMDGWVFRFILPEAMEALPHGTAGVVTAILLGVLNARGTEESGTFQLVVTGAKVAVLLAFIVVNVAVIRFRRERSDMSRPYEIPFYPIPPVLGIVLNSLLAVVLIRFLIRTDLLVRLLSVGRLAAGGVMYLPSYCRT